MRLFVECTLVVIIIIIENLIFKIYLLPDGAGKFFAWFGIAIIPVLTLGYYNDKKDDLEVEHPFKETMRFIGPLIGVTLIVLTVVIIIFIIFGEIFSKELI